MIKNLPKNKWQEKFHTSKDTNGYFRKSGCFLKSIDVIPLAFFIIRSILVVQYISGVGNIYIQFSFKMCMWWGRQKQNCLITPYR